LAPFVLLFGGTGGANNWKIIGMTKLGIYMLLFGLGSTVLHFLHREFIILFWINLWGPDVAWIIRISMMALGGLLFLVSLRTERTAD